MFNFGSKILLIFLLAFPCGLISNGQVLADSEYDSPTDEEEEDEEEVEEEEEAILEEEQTQDEADVEEAEEGGVTAHPDADTTIAFISGEEFPANEIVKFLVGFTNKGTQDLTVQSLEASFRYPQDYEYYIQNFTALPLNTVVQPMKQASFEYSFIPAQPMAGRPFGLVILLNYIGSTGNAYQSAIFNQTVTITEKEEGLDGETIFLYIFLIGLVVLMLFSVYQVLDSRTRKRAPVKMERGTGGMNDVDISWIPQETLNAMNRASPKASPKSSPRKRTKRAMGVDQ